MSSIYNDTNPSFSGPTGGSSLAAFFDSRSEAESAVSRLEDAGVPVARIRLMPGYEADRKNAGVMSDDRSGFFDALADFFFPDEDRAVYAEGLRRGGFLVRSMISMTHFMRPSTIFWTTKAASTWMSGQISGRWRTDSKARPIPVLRERPRAAKPRKTSPCPRAHLMMRARWRCGIPRMEAPRCEPIPSSILAPTPAPNNRTMPIGNRRANRKADLTRARVSGATTDVMRPGRNAGPHFLSLIYSRIRPCNHPSTATAFRLTPTN